MAESTILGFRAENFKRIYFVEIKPAPTGLVEIQGPNGAGKSSILDAISAALEGGKACPQKPIREGANSAEIEIDLGDLVVRRKWTDPANPEKTYLSVEDKNGATFRSPQAILDRLTGAYIDPLEFMRLKPAEQIDKVLALVSLPIDLAASKREETEAEQERLLVGREGKTLAGTVEGLRREVSDSPAGRVDLAALSEKLQGAARHNAGKAALQTALRDANREKEQAAQKVNGLLQILQTLQQQIADLVEKQKETSEIGVPQANEALRQAIAHAAATKATLDEFTEIDEAAIRKEIQRAESNNRKLDVADRLAERERELVAQREAYEALSRRIEIIRNERRRALDSVVFPVEGLGYDPEQATLTLNHVPFAQASQAEQLRASAELAMAQDAKLHIAVIRDGSLLDSKHKAMLAELISSRGWQCWIERVADGPTAVGFYVEEGQLKQ